MLTQTYSGEGQVAESQLQTSRSFMAMDRAAQAFVQNWIDPLLGNSRSKHIKALAVSHEASSLSLIERSLNRYLGVAVATLVLASAGSLLFPPLLLVAAAGALFMSMPVYQEAYRTLTKNHKVNVAVLVAVNVTGTWLYGYYVASAMGLFLYHLGQKLVYHTRDRSQHSLVDVYGQQARSVWVLVNGVEIEIPFAQVQAGDVVVVQAGQSIPVDGTIIQGIATIDQHTLTGEAQPVEKGLGAQVFATTTILTGLVHIQVEKAGNQTSAAQIAEMLNHASSYQMSLESQALRLANQLSVPTLILSGLYQWCLGHE